MAGSAKGKRNINKLSDWKQAQAERTRDRLEAALDRFESGKVINVAKDQKLTRLALAKEAEVAPDTPFSRYRIDNSRAGEYRFPEVVGRFDALRKRLSGKSRDRSLREEVKELKQANKHLNARLEANRRVVNAQDIKIEELETRMRDVEELLLQRSNKLEAAENELRRLRKGRLKGGSE
jgi:hypothetical protein